MPDRPRYWPLAESPSAPQRHAEQTGRMPYNRPDPIFVCAIDLRLKRYLNVPPLASRQAANHARRHLARCGASDSFSSRSSRTVCVARLRAPRTYLMHRTRPRYGTGPTRLAVRRAPLHAKCPATRREGTTAFLSDWADSHHVGHLHHRSNGRAYIAANVRVVAGRRGWPASGGERCGCKIRSHPRRLSQRCAISQRWPATGSAAADARSDWHCPRALSAAEAGSK